jgi:hypothetical protein
VRSFLLLSTGWCLTKTSASDFATVSLINYQFSRSPVIMPSHRKSRQEQYTRSYNRVVATRSATAHKHGRTWAISPEELNEIRGHSPSGKRRQSRDIPVSCILSHLVPLVLWLRKRFTLPLKVKQVGGRC